MMMMMMIEIRYSYQWRNGTYGVYGEL